MIHALFTVLGKELVDALRDRRTVAMALLFPLLGPAVLALAIRLTTQESRSAMDDPLRLPVAGREHAPNLVAFLEAGGAEVVAAPADPAAAVRAGDADVALAIPPEFGARLRDGFPAPVRLYVDESRRSAGHAVDRVRALLDAWSSRTAAQRLALRGVHPAIVQPVAVEEVDLSTPESRAAIVLGAMPYFLVLAIFIGGMSSAIDATAGERERQSLEPLLVNPVPRGALVGGKILAAAAFGALALAETLLGFAVVPLLLPIEELGFSIRLGPGVLLGLFGLLVPLVLASTAYMVLMSARAKTFRAAQTALSFVMLVPAIPGMVIAFSPLRLEGWKTAVPALGEQMIAAALLRGDAVPPQAVLSAMGATSVLAVLFTWLAVRRFRSEKLLF